MAAPSGVRVLKKGDVLFREGDPSDAMYVIKKGRIGILKNKGSSEVTLAELVPGEMLGEMAFFDNKPRSASAKAVQVGTANFIDPAATMKILDGLESHYREKGFQKLGDLIDRI